jgi:MFS family permease
VSKYGFSDVWAVLRIRNYRNFLLSRIFATLSTQMQALVVSWQIYQMTKDPLALGLIGLVEAVAFIAFATWAGHFADRHEKRGIIFWAQGILLVCAVAFMGLTHWSGLSVHWLYAVVALTGFARSYMWPASFAYSELTVPREIYGRAASLNSTGWEVASIVGPAIGGFVYAWRGPVVAYGLVFVLMALAVFFTMRMGAIEPSPPSSLDMYVKRGQSEATDEGSDFLSGFRFVFKNPVILSAISLDMFAVLFGGVYAILPIFADVLGVGAKGLGWLRAAPSIGAMVMAGYQAWRPPFEQVGKTLLAAVTLFGVFTIAFAFSMSYPISLLLLALCGMVDNISVVIRASIMQAFTPNDMRGRVSAVNGIFIGSSNEIGAFESGLAAKLMGTVPSVIFGGTMTLLTVALIAWKSPVLRRLKGLHKLS